MVKWKITIIFWVKGSGGKRIKTTHESKNGFNPFYCIVVELNSDGAVTRDRNPIAPQPLLSKKYLYPKIIITLCEILCLYRDHITVHIDL